MSTIEYIKKKHPVETKRMSHMDIIRRVYEMMESSYSKSRKPQRDTEDTSPESDGFLKES